MIFIKTNKLGRIIENKYHFVKFWIKHDFLEHLGTYVARKNTYWVLFHDDFSWTNPWLSDNEGFVLHSGATRLFRVQSKDFATENWHSKTAPYRQCAVEAADFRVTLVLGSSLNLNEDNRGRADFSFGLYFRPAKKAKTAFNNKTIGKEGHKDQMCNNLFSLFVADIVLFLKHFFKFQLFFSKNSLKILLFVLIYGQLSGTESTFTWKSRNLDPPFMVPNRVVWNSNPL